MITKNDLQRMDGVDVHGPDGAKIGSVGQVYVDRSGQPVWVAVRTGLFGTKESFVPLAQANMTSERLDVPFGKDQVKDAPTIDSDGHLSEAEAEALYTYYGLDSTDQPTGTNPDDSSMPRHAETGAQYDHAMTRSEEQLHADTRTEQTGTARLRKYVVTGQQQVNVPVSREEVHIEREPITGDNVGDAMHGAEISEDEHQVTLNAQRPVVSTETVPVERVRLGKETVTDTETVSGQVRKEQIDTDTPGR